MRAYDVVTGKQVWRFNTIPQPGEFGYDTWPKDAYKYIGAVNTWGELSVDVARGIAFFPTGSPTYDYYGADRPGSNLYGTSLLALDARTGKRIWHFQLVHHDLWDFDTSSAPQLTTIVKDGKRRDVVALAGKSGFLYVFDRVTGEPIWPIEERPVPMSGMPGEKSWPTQPFPTVVPPFSKLNFTEDDINPFNNITPEEREAFREKVRGTKNLGMFTPIDFIDTLHIPGSNGGSVFGTAASEPGTGMVYVIGQNNPGILRLMRTGEPRNRFGGAATPGEVVYQRDCQSCHGPNRAGTDSAPSLVGVTERLNDAALRATVNNGKGRMPAFPHLTDTEMATLADLSAHAVARAAGTGGVPGAGVSAGTGGRHRRGAYPAHHRTGRDPRAARGDTVSRGLSRHAAVHHQRVRHHRQADEAALHDDHQVRPQHPGDRVAGGLRRRPGAGREGHDRHGHAADAQRRRGDRHRALLRGRRRQQGPRLRHRQRHGAVDRPLQRHLPRHADHVCA